jgi:hypothetical protein
VALSRVKRPADLCIVLPPDEDHFLIEPSVDLDVVRILDTFTSGMTPAIRPPLPVDEVNPGLPFTDCPGGNTSDGLPCFGDDSHDPDDETDCLQHSDDDPEEIADPPPVEIPRNNAKISSLLEDQVLLGINCLGPERAQIQLTQRSVSLASALNCAIGTSTAKLITLMSSSGISSRQILMQSLAQIKTLFGRYLILYRASLQMLTRISKCETLMIQDVIGPGLSNKSNLCYISAFVQLLFHVLPLRPIIRYWPNQNHTMSQLRAVFAEMCENRVTELGGLSDVCEPNVRTTKDCSEFALQIIEAMRSSSSGRLKASIENLICFQITTRVWGDFFERFNVRPLSILLELRVFGSTTLIECLDSNFGEIQMDCEPPQTQQHFISIFAKFLLIHLGRDVWNGDSIEKDCRSIAFSMMLDMAPYAFHRNAPVQYQLGGVIAHIGLAQEDTGHYITFLRIYGQWFLFDGIRVQSVTERAALNDNFPEAVWSTQTASILLYVLQTDQHILE